MVVAIVSVPVPSQNQGFLRRPAEKFNYPNSIVLTALRQVEIEGARAAYNQMCLAG